MRLWSGFRRWFGVIAVLVFVVAYVPAARYARAGGPGKVPATPRATELSSPLHLSQEEFAERIRLKSQRRQFVSGAAHTRRNSVGIARSADPGVLITGFEVGDGFVLGPIDEQAGWFAFFSGDPEGHIDDVHAALGAQHLRISWDPALFSPTDTGAFSPDLGTLPTGASTTKVDIAISATGGADYFVAGQSNSEGFLTWEVNFSFLGTIWVVDDLGSGLTFVDTGFTWTIGPYKTLTVLDDPVAGGTVYLYDDVLFYSQVTHLQGTRVEQVVFRSDNFHLIDDGDFDNLSVTSGIDCDDGIACTTDAFDAATGCANTPVHAACDDSNVCTTDTCDSALGCLNDGTGTIIGCDDGDACTTGDSCQGDAAGTCQGTDTSAVDCDDLIACTADTCDPATGCANTPVNAACDDGNVCTTDTCDPVLGCLNDGTGIIDPCNDGNACTTTDVCQGDAAGSCQGTECVLDLDGNGVMGTGDFALFAACFGACYPVGDPCVASNFDGDPNRCVGTSDFAAWVGCFGLTCGECAGCAGPGLRGGATAPGTTRVVGGPNDEMHGVAVVGEFKNIDPGMIEFGHADLTVRGVRKPTNWIRGRR